MIENLPLPYPSFTQSVKCYSDYTLMVLSHQLPRVYPHLRVPGMYDIPHSHYEIWRAWRDWEPAFAQFMLMCYRELDERGLACDEALQAQVETYASEHRLQDKPQWVGWEPIHAEYRRYLLHLGGCERVAARICAKYDVACSPFNSRLKRWMERNLGLRHVHIMNAMSLQQAERRLHLDGIPELEEPNHYMQFDWDSRRPWHGFEIHVHEPGQSYLC